MWIAAIIGAVGAVIGGLSQYFSSQKALSATQSAANQNMWLGGLSLLQQQQTNEQNYKQQQQNLEWQKAMQRESWQREDTAVQRRAADLKAAGISPLLAAGSAATASGPIQTHAPQKQNLQFPDFTTPQMQVAKSIQQVADAKANVAQTIAGSISQIGQARAINAKADLMESEAGYARVNAFQHMRQEQEKTRYSVHSANKAEADNWYRRMEAKYFQDFGSPAGGGGIGKDLKDLYHFMSEGDILNRARQEAQQQAEEAKRFRLKKEKEFYDNLRRARESGKKWYNNEMNKWPTGDGGW